MSRAKVKTHLQILHELLRPIHNKVKEQMEKVTIDEDGSIENVEEPIIVLFVRFVLLIHYH